MSFKQIFLLIENGKLIIKSKRVKTLIKKFRFPPETYFFNEIRFSPGGNLFNHGVKTMTEKRRKEITTEIKIIKSLLKFVKINIDTGIVTWTKSRSGVKVGDEAGCLCLHNGYRSIGHNGRNIRTHRLVFYAVHGRLPELIDHRNRIKTNNWIDNLREATKEENAINCSISKNNTSGTTGVCWNRKTEKWQVRIKLSGKTKSLGYFSDKSKAIAIRKEAELKYCGDFLPITKTKRGQ